VSDINPLEIGLVFWAEESADATLAYLKGFGLRAGQLGVPPGMDCEKSLDLWKSALQENEVVVTSAVCCYAGEDYADIERVHQTVGFTVEKYRPERIRRTREIAKFADALSIRAVSCHIGFIPEDREAMLYKEMRDLTRLLCDACAAYSQDFVLETGQESAKVLLGFIRDVQRPNLKVNFDPANMVLYGSGDPLEALVLLHDHVLSIHCKDGLPPAPGTGLGREVALGDGKVDFVAFLTQLKKMNYHGILSIEREEPDAATKAADIRTAISRLKSWKAQIGMETSASL
jgi:sugar phosphate isomerase/epimerase